MSIIPANKENIKKAAAIIRAGGLVAFPTETVYGLGANALNATSVSRIFEVKKRPFFDPIIVHISSLPEIEGLVKDFGEMERKLAERFWPGPLTLVLPKKNIVPDIVTSGLATVGIRMPANETAREFVRESGTPIAAPSANIFGQISPTQAAHVESQLGSDVDMILDGGKCSVGIESTIIKIENGVPIILRHGGLPVDEIEKVAGKVISNILPNKNIEGAGDNNGLESPGQLPYHYSPLTPLVLFEDFDEINITGLKAGLILFKKRRLIKDFFAV